MHTVLLETFNHSISRGYISKHEMVSPFSKISSAMEASYTTLLQGEQIPLEACLKGRQFYYF